jgi:hypothetical protein
MKDLWSVNKLFYSLHFSSLIYLKEHFELGFQGCERKQSKPIFRYYFMSGGTEETFEL